MPRNTALTQKEVTRTPQGVARTLRLVALCVFLMVALSVGFKGVASNRASKLSSGRRRATPVFLKAARSSGLLAEERCQRYTP